MYYLTLILFPKSSILIQLVGRTALVAVFCPTCNLILHVGIVINLSLAHGVRVASPGSIGVISE